jgi:pimeloyl-ACP methyl ester carboxylesterase
MAFAETAHGSLYYELIDLTPPWITNPPAIVFLQGIGADADLWSDWLPLLAGRFRLLRFDMRGFGRSHRPDHTHTWTFTGMSDDLFAVVNAAGIERFHLVGESIGGTIALYTAIHHGERLLSAGCVSCSHKGSPIGYVREWQRFIDDEGMPAWSRQMMQRRFYEEAIPTEIQAWFEQQQASGSVAAILGLAEMLIGADLTAQLAGITMPVLVLHPDASPFVPLPIAAELHSLLPDSEMQVFAGSKHGLACSHARDCAVVLADFIGRRV